jgi:hypothetical protein
MIAESKISRSFLPPTVGTLRLKNMKIKSVKGICDFYPLIRSILG